MLFRSNVLNYLVKINQSEEDFNSDYSHLKESLDRVFEMTKFLCSHEKIRDSNKSISKSWEEVKNEIDDQYQNFKQEHIKMIQGIVESYHSHLIYSEENRILAEEITTYE